MSPDLHLAHILFSVVREINKINERELESGVTGSWHDDYKGVWLSTSRDPVWLSESVT